MTKKDYELVARVFNKELTKTYILIDEFKQNLQGSLSEPLAKLREQRDKRDILIVFCDRLATEFKTDNRDFDYDKFMNTSGVLNNQFNTES